MSIPEIHNSSKQLLAIANNIVDGTPSRKKTVAGVHTLKFRAHQDNLKSEYLDPSNMLWTPDDSQYLDIKYVKTTHKKSLVYQITAEHVSYRLADGETNTFPSFATTGTPNEILTEILNGTEFTVGQIDFTTSETFSINEQCTRRSVLYAYASHLGGEVEYSNGGFEVNIKTRLGGATGYDIMFGKNMLGLEKHVDVREATSTWYVVNAVLLANSVDYIKNGLSQLEEVNLGDDVHIYDPHMAVDMMNRIFSITDDPWTERLVDISITSETKDLASKLNQIESDMVKKNAIYNTCSISTDYGFRSVASDNSLRTTMSYGGLTIEVYENGWIPIFQVVGDPETGQSVLEITGRIKATSIIEGAEIIGGSIYIGGGVFSVDNNGRLIAQDILIGDGFWGPNMEDLGLIAALDQITPADTTGFGDLAVLDNVGLDLVTDAGVLAALDAIDTVHITDDAITAPKILSGQILARHILAGQITADKIYAQTLSGLLFLSENSGGDQLRLEADTQQIRWKERGTPDGTVTSFIDGNAQSSSFWGDYKDMNISTAGKVTISASRAGIELNANGTAGYGNARAGLGGSLLWELTNMGATYPDSLIAHRGWVLARLSEGISATIPVTTPTGTKTLYFNNYGQLTYVM